MIEFAHLQCHSNFSLLDGASHPEVLVARAAELGMSALALTDHDAVYGAVRFVKAAREQGIRPILGAELTLEGDYHLTLLAQDATGWGNLCQLITLARHNAPKGEALLPDGALEGHTDGLIALSGCKRGEIPTAVRRGDTGKALEASQRYIHLFGKDRFFIELQHHLLPGDNALVADLVALAKQVGVSYVATNNVHYAYPDGHRLQDVLTCMRHKLTLDEGAHLCKPNNEYYLKSPQEMWGLFSRYPQAITNSVRIAERCHFELDFGLQTLPVYPTPEGMDTHTYLQLLCKQGLQDRRIEPTWQVLKQLEHELGVIERSGLSNYFLIVWDMVRFSREQNISCQGRGSAANSLVAYLLGISPVNPLEHNLVFERFLSDERQAVPDIDIDFQADRREEVIQYVYQRYGHAHAAMACTFVTFRARSALRDVGKVLGLPLELLDRVSKSIDTFRSGAIAEKAGIRETIGSRVSSHTWTMLFDLCRQIDGFPHYLGLHNGGMVVMGAPLAERLPTEPAKMKDRVVVQWDKDSLEDAGLIKIDILGLRILSAIAETVDTVQPMKAIALNLKEMTFDDPLVFEMLRRGDSIGVFNGSRANQLFSQMFGVYNLQDVTTVLTIVRPGPMLGGAHALMRRRLGQEPIEYPHPLLEPALRDSYGVMISQEQVLFAAQVIGGFTLGQGELLRRALGAKRAVDQLERFRNAFLEGAQAKGIEQAIATSIFDTLRAFGSYSFPKSHAAAFAVLVYQSAWLKRYYPAYFTCALLNNQPMGFWQPSVIVNDARRHGLKVLPVDVNVSSGKCTVEDEAIRLGFNYIKGFGDVTIERVMSARENGAFISLLDFCKRTQLPQTLVENLILAGAMDGWKKTRRKLIWELGKLDYRAGTLDLTYVEDEVNFPAVSPLEVIGIEYAMMGLSLQEHPIAFYRSRLSAQGILGSRQLSDCPRGKEVSVAGMVIVHQAPPTAKDHHFLTLDDEHGFINIIIRPKVFDRYRRILRESPLLVIDGTVQHQGKVINVIASRISALL